MRELCQLSNCCLLFTVHPSAAEETHMRRVDGPKFIIEMADAATSPIELARGEALFSIQLLDKSCAALTRRAINKINERQ